MDTTKPSETPETKLHFLDYWRIIRLRKTVILAVFLLVLLTTAGVTWYLKPTYASMARIAVEKDVPDVPGIGGQVAATAYDPFFLQTEFEKIQSKSILHRVIEDLELHHRWSRDLNLDQPMRVEQAYHILEKRISVKQTRNTSLIEIWVYSRGDEEAAEIANKIAEVYRESRLRQRQVVRKLAIEELSNKLELKDNEIREAQAVVDDMRHKHGISDIGSQEFYGPAHLLPTDRLRRLDQAHTEAHLEFVQFENLLHSITNMSRAEMRQALPTAYPDQQLTTMLLEHGQAELRLTGLLEHFSREHPEVLQMQEVVNRAEQQIAAKIDGIIRGLQTRVDYVQAKLNQIDQQKKVAEEEHRNMIAALRPYFDAKRRLETDQRVREALNLRIEQERVELLLPTTSIVEIVDGAEPAFRPVRPNVMLNIALGIIVGLIVGVGLAFFIEYLDTSVKTIDDVERALQAPVLAVIPQNVGVLLEEGPESPHAEAYRVLRTNLLFSRKEEGANTITVVSGGAGEGKSTTLFNLATVFAQNGHRVLVVDSDLRRPSIHKMLKVSNSVGLTNYLLKQNTLEEVIQTTSIPTMDFMPSGKLPSSSMGILSSAKMKELMGELKRRYDFVFFDSPPLLGVSDASILASAVDLVLQVIQYRRYPQPMTIRAKQMILKVGGTLAGIVLNNINVSQDENYYYYSGYYYDYYSSYSKRDDDDAVKEPEKKPAKETAQVDIKSKF